MNLLSPLVESAWAERIGWSLVHSVWQIALVAALFAIGSIVLRRSSANARYGLGCLALLAMVAWPAATLMTMPMEKLERPPSAATITTLATLPATTTSAAADAVPFEAGPPLGQDAAPQPSFNPVSIEVPFHWESAVGVLRQWLKRMDFALPWLAACWVLGVSLLALRPLWGLVVVRRLQTRGLAPLSTELRKLAGHVMMRLRVHAAVRFAESALIEVPTVVGYFRPMVLLPASAVTGLSTEQLEMVMAHELAHIRRHDYLLNLLQTVIEALLFYHPCVWWVSAQVRRERENCCDDVAVSVCGNRGQYVRALYTLESRRVTTVPALAAGGGSLVARVRRLAFGPTAATAYDRATAWMSGLVALAIVIVVFSLGRLYADDTASGRVQESEVPVEKTEEAVPVETEVAEASETDSATSDETLRAAVEPASRMQWIVVGRVTDADGQPMAGVEVKAFSGVGTLYNTGSAMTDSHGNYQLVFQPGLGVARGSNTLQAATISARKPGYFEQNLNRQGNYRLAHTTPTEEELKQWDCTLDQVFLPGERKAIHFVMQPAAVLEGEFFETSSRRNVSDQEFYLIGDELPPSQSVLTNETSDDHGRFRVDAIPTGRDWRIGMRVPHTWVEIETPPLQFKEPGVYRCKLVLDTRGGEGGAQMSLRVEDMQQAATGDQVREIDRLDEQGFSKLHRAAAGGHADRVRELLSAGANVDVQQGTYHGTPLQYAASGGHAETVQSLLEHQATVDARDSNRRTPLVWAATKGHADVIRRLLDAGAAINATNQGGWTPLHYAVSNGHEEAAQLLIDRRANVRAKNSQGKTPFDLNPELNLRIPWRELGVASAPDKATASPNESTPDAFPRRPPAAAGADPNSDAKKTSANGANLHDIADSEDDALDPQRQPADVVAMVLGRDIPASEIEPPPSWFAEWQKRVEAGTSREYDTPEVYRARRLAGLIAGPLFDEYRKQEKLEPTEEQIAEFLKHYQLAKVRSQQERARELEQLRDEAADLDARLQSGDLSAQEAARSSKRLENVRSQIATIEKASKRHGILEDREKQDRRFAEWQLRNWNLQASLYRRYGGRAVWQQAGNEALDAMRDYLREQERDGKFTIHDPSLREKFWNIYAPEKLMFEIRDPDRLFKHPWSAFEPVEDPS